VEGEEGEKLRNNMKELKENASNAVKEEGLLQRLFLN
jgi:hypothetical protein